MKSILISLVVMIVAGLFYGAYGAYQIWKLGQFDYTPSPEKQNEEEINVKSGT
jgi:hypothetical protein